MLGSNPSFMVSVSLSFTYLLKQTSQLDLPKDFSTGPVERSSDLHRKTLLIA